MRQFNFFPIVMLALAADISCTADRQPERSCTKAVIEVAAPISYKATGGETFDMVSDLVVLASDSSRPYSLAMSLYADSGDLGRISIFFPDDTATYDVFVLANFGDVRESLLEGFEGSGLSLREYLSVYRQRFPDYSLFESRGVPMAGGINKCRPGSNVHIRLSRLVAILDVSFDIPSSVRLNVKDFSLMQCSAVCEPFSSGFKAEDVADMIPGAALSLPKASLASLSGGSSVRMCLLENSLGRLLSGNIDPRRKTPANTSCPELVSYYEFHADVVLGDGAQYKDAVFRFCLGRDAVSDFSVDRNTLYTYKIKMRDGLEGVEWIVDPGEPMYPTLEVTGHYSCSFFWDEAANGQVRCCSESLYFDVRSGNMQFSRVPFRFYHYDVYGREYVFGPFTTMRTYIEDWNLEHGQNGPDNPDNVDDKILIYFESGEYLYDYHDMNIVYE